MCERDEGLQGLQEAVMAETIIESWGFIKFPIGEPIYVNGMKGYVVAYEGIPEMNGKTKWTYHLMAVPE
jgi:hypothetical protein